MSWDDEAVATPPTPAALATFDAEAVRQLLAAIASAPRNAVVLIDGPSGSGKSTLADVLIENWPTDAAPQLVRLDDVYPGWGGLEAGAELIYRELLGARAAGREAGWRRWSWATNAPAEWHPIDNAAPVVVEGCGAFGGEETGKSTELADVTVWVSADDVVRKERALVRDAGSFDAHWDEWQAQWQRYVDRNQPRARAQFVVRVD